MTVKVVISCKNLREMTEKFGKSEKGASLLIRKGKLNECCCLRPCLGELRPFQGFGSKKIPDSICLAGEIYSCTANIFFFFPTTLTSLLVCLRRAHLIKHLVNANVLHSGSPFPFFFPKGALLPFFTAQRELSACSERRGKKEKKSICDQIAPCQRATRSSEKSCPVGFTFSLHSVCVIAATGRAALWVTRTPTAASSVGRAEEIIFHM